MNVSLSGATKNAADAIESLLDDLRERCDSDDFDEIEAVSQARDSVFILREISKHASETAKGKHTVDEFVKHYCLTPNN